MSQPRYDFDRAAAMLRELREVEPDRRIDTLAIVCRSYLDSTASAWPRRHPDLAKFFESRPTEGT